MFTVHLHRFTPEVDVLQPQCSDLRGAQSDIESSVQAPSHLGSLRADLVLLRVPNVALEDLATQAGGDVVAGRDAALRLPSVCPGANIGDDLPGEPTTMRLTMTGRAVSRLEELLGNYEEMVGASGFGVRHGESRATREDLDRTVD